MSTFMANAGNVEKKWYIIDAADKPLGRVATQVARILRGKHKPTFTPHVNTGDHVIVLNASKIVLTGKKLDQKMYRRHTLHPGGLKEMKYRDLMATKPERAVMLAVKGMLPKNSLGKEALTNLRVYRGAEHNHEAQKPEVWTQEL
ncbi:50S ribosomal protein L13 [Petroclostridium sp. X23]|jgi:large subunit ribosomal protein L13|uniref:50S ribosomal protein L13 n=1 Tax=Petroclostridium sp. X23 TaxID=3045146 RepID=UPI0024AE54D5|nr:50S ribosomal protein L13 [Petroclostridium sp. X23]WHH57427.1 50S ribosomal protein L13 [Petroclostridium sp. X23]